MRKTKKVSGTVALASAMVLSVAACGSSSSTNRDICRQTAETTAAAESSAAETTACRRWLSTWQSAWHPSRMTMDPASELCR